MAILELTIPDSLVAELEAAAQHQGYPNIPELLKDTLRSLLIRSRLEENTPSLSAQVSQELP